MSGMTTGALAILRRLRLSRVLPDWCAMPDDREVYLNVEKKTSQTILKSWQTIIFLKQHR